MRPLEDKDVDVMFGAYKMGCPQFELPAGLSQEEFEHSLERRLQGWNHFVTLLAPVRGNDFPVGVVGVGMNMHRMEPHVIWFPWASARNRLEAAIAFLNEARKDYNVLILARMEDAKFYDRLKDYKILRRVGTPQRWFTDGEPAAFYQSNEMT